MARTLRILILLPLLAGGIDLMRATVLCGPQGQTCLEAAGGGWVGPLAILLVAATVGFALTRVRTSSFTSRCAVGATALAATTAAQVAIAGAGGYPLTTVILCLLGGVIVALALKVGKAIAELAPRAPRALPKPIARILGLEPPPQVVYVTVDGYRRGRAPPRSS